VPALQAGPQEDLQGPCSRLQRIIILLLTGLTELKIYDIDAKLIAKELKNQLIVLN